MILSVFLNNCKAKKLVVKIHILDGSVSSYS